MLSNMHTGSTLAADIPNLPIVASNEIDAC